MQEYSVELIPLNGDPVMRQRFEATDRSEAVHLLNQMIDQFQTKCLRRGYHVKHLACYHPVSRHDVMTEPFVHLHKYHRHTDGVVYLTYREFEPVYGDDTRRNMSPVSLIRR
jgi:hypothetical protein